MSNADIHSFSRALAKEYGVTGAIILGFIGHKIAQSKKVHIGKRWHFDTLDQLALHYPYLSRTVIYETLRKLAAPTGPLITGNFNKQSYDRTTWYAFRNEQAQRHLAAEPLYFRVSEAERHGVLAAVLLNNLRYWIRENRKTDSNYRFHTLSPSELAKILPFSESAIKRSLKRLTSEEVGVLVVQRRSGGKDASEYAFAHESGLALFDENSGPIPNEISGSIPDTKMHIPNMVGPIPNRTGPFPNRCGPFPNVSGPIRNNNTLLIDPYLKDACLKDPYLKETYFQSACVFDKLPPSIVSIQDQVSTLTSVEPSNEFEETVDGNSEVSVESKFSEISYSIPSPSSKSSSPLSPPPPSLAKSEVKKPAHLLFLDSEVDAQNTKLVRLLSSLRERDDMRLKIAELAVDVIGELVRGVKPEDLMHFVEQPNQGIQDKALVEWATPFFNAFYEKRFSKPESEDNEECRNTLTYYCQRILSMAFHWVKYPDARHYVGQPFAYNASLNIIRIINPWREEQARLGRAEQIKSRVVHFKSPDQHLENDLNLSASEKMKVFVQSIIARNKVGVYDDRGKFVQQVVNYNQSSNTLVREFFQLNPEFTVSHLNLVLDECLKLPANYYDDDKDPQWHARNGRDISRFIRSLDVIATQLNVLDQLPTITPLPPHESEQASESITS